MIEIKTKPKKWGNSLAVILPEAVVKKANIKEGVTLELLIPEHGNMESLWGTLKTKKSTSELKKEAEKGWN